MSQNDTKMSTSAWAGGAWIVFTLIAFVVTLAGCSSGPGEPLTSWDVICVTLFGAVRKPLRWHPIAPGPAGNPA